MLYQVVEDTYFGKDSPATLKKFLGIVNQIKEIISKKKGDNNVKQVFEQFDSDKSGALSHGEFSVGLFELGIHLTPDETKMLLHYFDPNNDGTITYDEFLYVVNNIRSLVAHNGRKIEESESQKEASEKIEDSLQKGDTPVGKLGKSSKSKALL